jgi:hypothetical protein
VIHGNCRISLASDAQLIDQARDISTALSIYLDIDVVTVASRMPGILAWLKGAPQLSWGEVSP